MNHGAVPHEDDLPILHLKKWGLSEFPYNPSHFKEGFISPTRRLLLLLSYDSEGLLLPLAKGLRICLNDSKTTGSRTLSDPHRNKSTSRKNISGSSEALELGAGYEIVSNDSESTLAFFSDVDSVAWGLIGTEGASLDDPFQELLFISGKHGVFVHAFSHFGNLKEAESSVKESDVGQGMWVEWGPLMTFSYPMFSVRSQSSDEECSSSLLSEKMEDHPDRSVNSKVWMHTFLAEAEQLTLDDVVYTKFPKKTLFPNNVVVSFRILNFHLQFPDFLSRASSTSFDMENKVVDNIDISYMDLLEPACGDALTSTYSCVKIFSDSSSEFVGFALSMVSPEHASSNFVNNQSCKKFVVVARILYWGLKWMYSVRLGDSMDNIEFDWIDFTFSYSFLICLSKSGFISLYGAVTGAYVGQFDVSNARSLGYCLIQRPNNDSYILDGASQPACHQNGGLISRRRFKRLHALPHSLFLGVMDEYGVVYVFLLDVHVLDEQFFTQNALLSPCHLEPGILSQWNICSADIGLPRVLRIPQGESGSKMQCRSTCFPGNALDKEYLISDENQTSQLGSHIIKSSGETKIRSQKVMVAQTMRKVFLPLSGFSEDDIVSFSPFGITRLIKRDGCEKKLYKVVHTDLQLDVMVENESSMQLWQTSSSETVGCIFDGFLYLVTKEGISVVLPSISVSPKSFPVEDLRYGLANGSSHDTCGAGDLFGVHPNKKRSPHWKIDVLDRVIIYDGPEVAERLSLENEWDLGMARIRHLQLALHYLVFDQIQNSLEMLVGVNLAVEAILRLLFAAVYLILYKISNDNEVSSASRLLALATSYATMVIRKYGLSQLNSVAVNLCDVSSNQNISQPSELMAKKVDEVGNAKGLDDLAKLLIVIRRLQRQLSVKDRELDMMHMDHVGLPSLTGADLPSSRSEDPSIAENSLLSDTSAMHITPATGAGAGSAENLALVPLETSGGKKLYFQNFDHAVVLAGREKSTVVDRTVKLENPRDMIARWDLNNMDLNTIVKDALLSGRLPLAVLRLHIHHLSDSLPETETQDTFRDIRIAGRMISYDLFLKGEIGLAVTTLQKLGEDVENSLKELVFGTFRRSLRKLVTDEMIRYVNLGPRESKILDTVALIERIYPCSSFFSTLAKRQKELERASNEDAHREMGLHILHPQFKNISILCGEIDGVILGSWKIVNKQDTAPEVDDDSSHAAYWAAAAAWADAWDQRVVDRVLIDQPLLMGVHLQWESQLEYHMCHNDWLEVSKLLDVIPSYALSHGILSISLDNIDPDSSLKYVEANSDSSYLEEMGISIKVSDIRVFRFFVNRMPSFWLRMLMEQNLAKKFIFLASYWQGTAEITSLLAQSGFLCEAPNKLSKDVVSSIASGSLQVINDIRPGRDSIQALHKIVVSYCSQNNLLHFLDIYLDIHQLALDQDSLSFLLNAAGNNEWVKCLLLLRVKGKEYEASFSNARAIALHNLFHKNKHAIPVSDTIIQAVDDIAEVSGEMAALATLMFAPAHLQECLSSGSVNRQCASAQCTLENLRPAFQRFPTMWKTLFSACFPQNSGGSSLALTAKGYSEIWEYVTWRKVVFSSSARDYTSILHMIPFWFPRAVRRLIQLHVQGPICWHIAELETDELSILRDIYYFINSSGHSEISALSWESAVQKHIEEELYASSLKEAEVGLEYHLLRGRALSAFSHLLSARVQNLKSNTQREGQLAAPLTGQSTVHMDVQTLLDSVSERERLLLTSVAPLAIQHFDDHALVASCKFLLDLCGLDSTTLQTDVAVLKRISLFYKSADKNQYRKLYLGSSTLMPLPAEGDIMDNLVLALVDHYHHNGLGSKIPKQGGTELSSQPSHALQLVLQHLEKASLPVPSIGLTCGSWLMNGNGDGTQLRSLQKASSEHWQLVTAFCQVHGIPPSIKYLAALARDNDWVGFLSEAQIGKYSFETVFQVASREFSDPCLGIHILTVLKNMQSRKIDSLLNSVTAGGNIGGKFLNGNFCVPVELFGIIAECEKLENPGEALLLKAKNLCWSILAIIASCFHDVPLLSCLVVWLEITAARETSAIKVNDIASQIANNVGAAVEATNLLPASSRTVLFHYSRKISKRRRLESIPVDTSIFLPSEDDAFSSIPSVIFEGQTNKLSVESANSPMDSSSMSNALSSMVTVLCEQRLFLPLLQAFEIFLPSCLLLPFIRGLQAFSQMRLPDAMAYLGSFSIRIKEESPLALSNMEKERKLDVSWITSTAVKAADVMLAACPSPYEKKCLLKLLAATDFGDAGTVAMKYQKQSWKLDIADPDLRGDECPLLGHETLDDASLLTILEKNGYWEQARSWAKYLEASGDCCWNSATDHVTEVQAEAMISEWKEFLQDVAEERVAIWHHCHALFIRYSYPALKAGQFFLRHADLAEKTTPARELHEMLLLALQWLSGMITQTMCCSLELLHEIEMRVWLLAVEVESHAKSEGEDSSTLSTKASGAGNDSNIIDHTANITMKIDKYVSMLRKKSVEKTTERENSHQAHSSGSAWVNRTKRRAKGIGLSKKPFLDASEKKYESESVTINLRDDSISLDESLKVHSSSWIWEERVEPAELEMAVLSLLDFGQITAARQLQAKLSPENTSSEILLVDTALKLAELSTPNHIVSMSNLDNDVRTVIESFDLPTDNDLIDPLKVLEGLSTILLEGKGRGLFKRIISVMRAANLLEIPFMEAFEKQPIELLQLLSLKAQDSYEEACLLVQTHSMSAASIAQILAESFLKGLLAAHRGGYMDSQKEEGPAPLLWRFSDFLKWAELCPSHSEIGHALMKLVITGQEIPHPCEVELLILSHHFYKLSACLDGVDVLVTLAATRVEDYVSDYDFSCLARLITGVGNFHALNFILEILIENGQLDLLLQKYSDADSSTADAVRRFRMAVITSLKQFTPDDLDSLASVYNHFDMKHDTASLLESRAKQSLQQWFLRTDRNRYIDLLESMLYFTEAAEVYSSIDAGNRTRSSCAQALLVSQQIKMPDTIWLNLSATNARRVLVKQPRFQEALVVAEAYSLNQPTEWALVLWERMLNPELTELFLTDFASVLPLHPSMLLELARFYRLEIQARGSQSHFTVWLSGGGIPAEWVKYVRKSFKFLLRTRDWRLKLQMAVAAGGFDDVVESCNRVLDKVPENAGPLILRKGHGGAYLPLM